MNINGDITFLVNREYTAIEIRDRDANTTFVKIELSPQQLSTILSRQGNVHCDIEVRALDRVGKRHENQTFEFEVPENMKASSDNADELANHADTLLSGGWKADRHFGSQNSFFKQGGKQYARVTIRRYI